MLRKFLLSSAAVIAVSGSAFAADLPSRKAPPVYVPPPPIFTWSGVYVGGQIGYGWGRDRFFNTTTGAVGSSSQSGVVGGAHIGYNWQTGLFVAGLEGDVNGSSYSGALTFPSGAATSTYGARIPIDGSVRGRIGVAYDRVLFYATGGAAFASIRNSYAVPGIAPFTIGRSRVGWTVGAGIEYALTNNWSLRAEYRYTDYGRYTDVFAGGPVNNRVYEHRIQAGFSYKFDMFGAPGPIVAKY